MEGFITFDDVNIKEVDIKALRENIGYVPQEPVLIIGTIKDNLLFGNKDASEEEIRVAIDKSNSHFVYELDNKLDTYIGSTSVMNLSGG